MLSYRRETAQQGAL